MFKSIVLPTLFCVAVAWTHAAVSHAQTVPYRSTGEGAEFYPTSETTGIYAASGEATPLGKFTATGELVYEGIPYPSPGVLFAGTFEGVHTDVAANGDELYSNIQGDVVLSFDSSGVVTGRWNILFDIDGGTGRFLGAEGSMVGTATNPPFDPSGLVWPFDWEIEGEIQLDKNE